MYVTAPRYRVAVVAAALLFMLSTGLRPALAADADAAADKSAAPVSYHTQIKPIFQAHCQGCHQPAKPLGDYVMTDFTALLGGGESGDAAIKPGHPEQSYLIEQITPIDGEALMPKNKPALTPDQIALISDWIAQGAHDDTPASAKAIYDADHPPVYHTAPSLTSLDYSPDGSLLAVAGHHEVLIHSADGKQIVRRLVGVSDRIESVRFSPNGTKLAVTGGAPARMGEVQVWEVATGKLLLSVQVTYDTVYGASWSPDGSKIAFGCADNTLRVIEADSGKEVLFMGSHGDWVLDTTFSVDGTHLATVGRDQTAKLTEFETERFVDNITSITPGALTGGLAAIARHPERDEILVGGADGTPRTYRMHRETKRVIGDDANLVRQMPAIKGRIFSVAFRPDGKQLAAASSLNGEGFVGIYSYDVDSTLTDELKKILEKRSFQRNAEEKKMVEDFRSRNVSQTASLTIPEAGIYSVAYHPSGKQLAVGGEDGQIRVVNTETGEIESTFSAVPLSTETESLANARPNWKFGSKAELQARPLDAAQQVKTLIVEPAEISLAGPFAYAQLIVTAELGSGDRVDVTRLAKYDVSGELASVDKFGMLQPQGDGKTELKVHFGGQSATVPVTLSGQGEALTADYIHDVTPILSKLGCNQGTCHGAKDGKAGFKLSLRGYDPIFDVRALTDDHASRRSNAAAPEESLMLLKAIGGVPHVGGQLTTADHKYYHVLKTWISQGAELELDTPRVAGIDVFPKNPVIQQIDSRQQVRVVARYSNGQTRDVTYEAFVESGNTEVAEINSSGLLTAIRRGEAPILARYEGAYAATTLTVMGDRSGFEWVAPETFNRIDELTAAKWQRMKILPSVLCTDAEFLRRVTFDLTGLPPTAEAVRTFLDDPRPSREKREAYVDYLVGSDAYVEHFGNKWADLLQVNGKFLGREGATLFRDWIRQQLVDNRPYDEFVKEILTATGSNKANPPASYFKVLRTPEDTMENTTHLFLGVRFNCNKCHDHPFERWTQDQYYETAAYFAQVDLKRAPESKGKDIGGTAVEGKKPLYETVADTGKGEMIHQRTGSVAAPEFPYDEQIPVPEEASRREKLAEWMTSSDNDYFARSYVNRLWGYLFGVGIIEPIDDIRAGNPPTNPELLDYLTEEFISSGFDVQHMHRLMCKSRTYQLSLVSNQWNEDDQINFSHAKARRLSAEALYDAVHLVTGAESQIPGVPKGTRAAALADSQIKLADGFLNNFGRPTRESSCECERSNEVQLGPVMAMVSGPTIADAIADPNNDLPTLVKEHADNGTLINELFVRILNRPATEQEIATAKKAFHLIDASHEQLVTRLAEKEAWWKPIRERKEQERLDAIAKAENDLAAYREKIAPKVAELEQQRLDKIAAAEKALADYEAKLDEPSQAWVEKQKSGDHTWHYLSPTEMTASTGAELKELPDGSILAKKKDQLGNYTLLVNTNLEGIRKLRLEALTHDSLPRKGPGLAPDGNFVLNEFRVESGPLGDEVEFTPLKLTKPTADFSQNNYEIAKTLDGQIKPNSDGWAVAPQQRKDHWATFEFAEPVGSADGLQLRFTMEHHYQSKQHWLGRFRLSVSTDAAADPKTPGLPQRLLELVTIPAEERTAEQADELLTFFKKQDKTWKEKQQAIAEAKKPVPIDPKIPELEAEVALAKQPVQDDPQLVQLRADTKMSEQLLENERLTAAQDVTWVLINSPAFLFNR
ncbi:DUF1549 domain-containing protein [Rubinisphaera sp. JC750]|uniref:DUF1549 domain-containing protein n=1 Tax=Rubinisphaera sp. JC750 TaxID=2898658 RepID=UPI001F375AF3|nr:DUF1549 domain-containing protein [Rubinisphaera sp. JC750]